MRFTRTWQSLLVCLCVASTVAGAQESRSAKPRNTMHAFLVGMPKAELHLHLEGSIDVETVVEISNRNNLGYFTTVEEIETSLADRPPGLMGFLEHHFKLQEVMRTRLVRRALARNRRVTVARAHRKK